MEFRNVLFRNRCYVWCSATRQCNTRSDEAQQFLENQKMGKGKRGKKEKRVQANPPLKAFKAWREHLRAQAEAAENAKILGKEPVHDHPASVFKRSVYGYYRRLRRAELMGALQEYIRDTDRARWNGPDETPAFWVLRLAAQPKESAAQRQRRRRLAFALELASLNKVRPELLIGFLHEVGSSELIESDAQSETKYKWAKNYREPAAPKVAGKRQVELNLERELDELMLE